MDLCFFGCVCLCALAVIFGLVIRDGLIDIVRRGARGS